MSQITRTSFGCTVTVALTNAQVLALPSSRIEIVPALGVGRIVVINQAWCLLDSRAGAYTNLDAAATLGFTYGVGGSLGVASTSFDEAAQGAFASADYAMLGAFVAASGGADEAGWIADPSAIDNTAIYLWLNNQLTGNLGDGNANNSLKVTAFYSVLTL